MVAPADRGHRHVAIELVNLTRADATRVLRDYLSGALTTEETQHWAEALEVRDDVAREPGLEDELTAFVFEMSTQRLPDPDVAAGGAVARRLGRNAAEDCRG